MIFAFANCELDVARRELRRDGAPVHVEPQVFDVLLHLVRHRDRVIAKEELFDAVWHGRIVSEATLTSRISAARRAIGDSGDRQDRLRTIARRGFRFCGEVEERVPRPTASLGGTSPAVAGPVSLSNLPGETTRLIGRDKDLAEVTSLMATARLVTLTGTGGVGKTRLALKVATAVAATYPDGAWLVELAPVGDPAAIGSTVAGMLGIAQQPGRTIEQSIVQSLSARRLLLVLDNCEHVIDAAATLAREIVAHCPHVGLLATSREAMAIAGEQSFPVAPLDSSGVASTAVELFVACAQRVVPDFTLASEPAAVSEICRRLEGIPLAIELAAARMRTMTASQIRDRLDASLGLLTRGLRDAPQRHRTLRAAMQWSYDLLSDAERTALARAAVFAGGFTLEAAEQVCLASDTPSVLDLLDQLVRKSLLTVERSADGVRYGMLEPIRQFGEEQLAARQETDAARLSHARFFAADSGVHFAVWRSADQPAAYRWLEREIGNLREAFRWAKRHGEIDLAAGIASNIGDMARFRLREDAALWAAEIVDAARTLRHRRLAVLLTWAASSAWSLGDLAQARRFAEEAISLAGNAAFDPFAWAFTDLGMVECYEGRPDRAVELVRAGAAQAADRHDRFCLAMLPHFLAVGGQFAEAQATADDAVRAARETAIPSSISIALWAKGEAFAQSDPVEALHAYEQAIALARQSGNRFWEVLATPTVAALQARSGDPVTALRSFEEMLEGSRRSADLIFMSHGLGRLTVLFDRLGQAEAAATLYAALSRRIEAKSFVPELPETIARVRAALGEPAFAAAGERGAAMPLHEATDFALAQVRQALAALTGGQCAQGIK